MGENLLPEQPDVVDIVDVVEVEVDRVHAVGGQFGEPVDDGLRAADRRRLAQRRATSALSTPQATGTTYDSRAVAGSRPISSHARRNLSKRSRMPAPNAALNSSAKRAASIGVRRGPAPPITIGGCGD